MKTHLNQTNVLARLYIKSCMNNNTNSKESEIVFEK